MIIDKIKKLVKFLRNKPVKAINARLDSAAQFFINQVRYAHVIALGALTFSVLGLIVPSQNKINTLNSSSTVETKVVDGLSFKKKLLPGLNSSSAIALKSEKFKLKPATRLSRLNSFLSSVKQKARRFPISFVFYYSLSHPEKRVRFTYSVRPYESQGQLKIISTNDKFDTGLSCGLYSNPTSIMEPGVSEFYKQVTSSQSVYSPRSFLTALKNTIVELWNRHDPMDVSYRILDETTMLNPSADSQNTDHATAHQPQPAPIQLVRSSAGRLNQSDALIPSSRRFNKFAKHLLSSLYFKADFLNIFIFRIEQ